MSDWITAFLLLTGGVFAVIGSVGLLRLPDVLIRMHASTKIGTLACGLIVAGSAVHYGTPEIAIRAIAIILFLLLTAPIAAHMIGRAAVSTGVPLWRNDASVQLGSDEKAKTSDASEDSTPTPKG